MELLAPAGNYDKLLAAYRYGADAAYIGLDGFSLRAQADNFRPEDAARVAAIKGRRKLYGAFNIVCRNRDIERFEEQAEAIRAWPFDALIVSDIGLVPAIRRHFPDMELHLSTQANCMNASAARMYRDLGFRRIVPGREMSLAEIAAMKDAVPDLEVEAFVHGAMCLAYSGRCFLSAWMAGRSANRGECAHSCRWSYRVLEEAQRPGEYFPIHEEEGATMVMSSRDLCLIDHLEEFRQAGVDSLKIEGRMKSEYYVAMVTRAYRHELDRVLGRSSGTDAERASFRNELFQASHREYCTGFFFGDPAVETPTSRSYEASHIFLGSVVRELDPDPAWVECHGGGIWHRYELDAKNKIEAGDPVETVAPHEPGAPLSEWHLVALDGFPPTCAAAGRYGELYVRKALPEGTLLRRGVAAKT